MNLIIRLFSLLPLGVLYAITSTMMFFFYNVGGYRKKVVRKNLQLAFPELAVAQRLKIERQFYRNFSQVIAEILRAFNMSAAEFQSRVKLTGPNIIEELSKQGKSVLLLASHQFNWEWLSLASATYLKSCDKYPVYKRLNNKKMDRLFYNLRNRFGSRPVEMNSDLLKIIRDRASVKCIGLLLDQSPLAQHTKFRTHFFVDDTPFYIGPDTLRRMDDFCLCICAYAKN